MHSNKATAQNGSTTLLVVVDVQGLFLQAPDADPAKLPPQSKGLWPDHVLCGGTNKGGKTS